MKKIISALLISVMVFSLAACGGGGEDKKADRLQEIKDRGYIELATEPYFAPYEFVDPNKSDDDQYVGMDIELAKAIADAIGVDLKIVPLDYSAVLSGITEGKYDMAISAIAYSPAREEAMNMSDGYYSAESEGYGFLVREADKDKYTSIESLKDAVVITQSASVQEIITNEQIKDCKEVKLVANMTDGYLAVSQNKADVCVCDRGSAALYAEANGGLAISDFVFKVDPKLSSVCVGVPLENTEDLMNIINQCISDLKEKDQFEKWFDEYADYAKTLGIQ